MRNNGKNVKKKVLFEILWIFEVFLCYLKGNTRYRIMLDLYYRYLKLWGRQQKNEEAWDEFC